MAQRSVSFLLAEHDRLDYNQFTGGAWKAQRQEPADEVLTKTVPVDVAGIGVEDAIAQYAALTWIPRIDAMMFCPEPLVNRAWIWISARAGVLVGNGGRRELSVAP